jgi:hypothetical protein
MALKAKKAINNRKEGHCARLLYLNFLAVSVNNSTNYVAVLKQPHIN